MSCYCPDDCNCRKPWRTTWCGCREHDEAHALRELERRFEREDALA